MTIALTVLGLLIAVLVVVGAALWLYTLRTVRRIEAAMPPRGRFVDVPGARLHVVERGQGPAVLLVHGLSGQLENFGYGMMEPLARHFRVIAVDRSEAVLLRARALARRRHVNNVTWKKGELERLPVRDGSVDVAMLSQALHHAHDPARA